jgi:hypothetical protein
MEMDGRAKVRILTSSTEVIKPTQSSSNREDERSDNRFG